MPVVRGVRKEAPPPVRKAYTRKDGSIGIGSGRALRKGTIGIPGQRQKGSHLGRRLAQLRAESRVLERLASLVLTQAEAGEERH